MSVGSLVELAARHRRTSWSIALVLTLASACGLPRLRLETGVLDWLPRQHDNVDAFRVLSDSLSGVIQQELLWLELDPRKARAAGVTRITDQQALLAQDELLRHIESDVDGLLGSFGVLQVMEILDRSLNGKQGESRSFLKSETRSRQLWELLSETQPALMSAMMAADGSGMLVTLLVDAASFSPRARSIGLELDRSLAAYRNNPDRAHDLFREEFLVPAGMGSGTALIDRSLKADLMWLIPAALSFLVVVLRWLLGSWRLVTVLGGLLAAGVIWALGWMGWLGITLNIVTVAIVPLLLGCGIDYSLLIAAEAGDHRRAGVDAGTAIARIGRGSAKAVVLTTLTTVAGLFALLLCSSAGVAALGLSAALGMLGLAALATLLLPSLVVRGPRRAGTLPAPGLLARAAVVVRRRFRWVLAACGAVTVLALIAARDPTYHLDIIEGNYPGGAPVTQAVERIREKCGGAFPEVVIVQGDLSDPRAIDRMLQLQERLRESPLVGREFQVVGLPDILAMHNLLKSRFLLRLLFRMREKGMAFAGGAAAGTGRLSRQALPSSSQELRRTVVELYSDPAWAPLVRMFVDEDLEVGTILLLGGDAGRDMQTVERFWRELDRVTQVEATGLQVSFLGFRTMPYLFAVYSMKWLQLTWGVALATLGILVAVFLRDWRSVLLVAAVMVISGIWWFAWLQASGVYISVFLLFPLVFAVCMGSDYALHLLCRQRAIHDEGDVPSGAQWESNLWTTTGRAIIIAALTDAGVFLIFTRLQLVSASGVMLATALAVVTALACTLLLVPPFVGRRGS